MTKDLEAPEKMTRKAKKIHATIMSVLSKDGESYTCGSRGFYTPKEWADRGEDYGRTALLIVTYDGGCLSQYFRGADQATEALQRMREALKAVGCYSEECTGWYSAIYPIPPKR